MRRSALLAFVLLLATACAPAKAPTRRNSVAVPLGTALAQSGGLPQGNNFVAATAQVLPEATPVPASAFVPMLVVAPSIGLNAVVVATDWTPGGEWRVPDGAAGWMLNSAYAGAAGNTVLAGHHNTQGEVFRRVADLHPGDSITLGADGQAVEYRVSEVLILPAWGISPEQERQYASWIARTRDTRLTLVTCWPYFTNSHRVIVVARPAG